MDMMAWSARRSPDVAGHKFPREASAKQNPAKCGVLPFGAPDSGGIGGTEAIRTRLLIVSRALSGEGSTGVRHAASPMSRPRHARLIGESQGDTSARCAPLPCPSGASATHHPGPPATRWVFSGSPLDFAG